MQTSDAVLVVVDASVGATETEDAIAKVLRRSKRPVILAVNKVDDERAEADAAALWSLGLGEPIAVSGSARPWLGRSAGRGARGACRRHTRSSSAAAAVRAGSH